ncbi:MAG: type II secretion system GspH family protein [Deltaproteobacteria bacterium]|nr:type II secretion system GspH family protein [Deltaproteobacteria bacterium]
MTLLEIMVVLAVIGLIMMMAVRSLSNVRASDLREEANKVLAILRVSYNGAAGTGKHVRVVFDLDEQKFWMEACEGDARVKQRDDNEEEQDEEEERNEKLGDLGKKVGEVQQQLRQSGQSSDQIAAVLQANSPEKAVEAAAALEGVRLGSATCQKTGDPLLEDRSKREAFPIGVIPKDSGRRIRRIHVKHLREPVEEGRVAVNFFPLGFAERAIVEIENEDGDVFSVRVHAVTGKVEILAGEVEDVDDFMLRDALGEREEEREE